MFSYLIHSKGPLLAIELSKIYFLQNNQRIVVFLAVENGISKVTFKLE